MGPQPHLGRGPDDRDPWLPELIGIALGCVVVACAVVGTILLLGARP